MKYNQDKFYNEESASYSQKRYEGPLLTYTQFLFRKRLEIFLSLLERILPESGKVTLFEIGCADGIIMQRALAAYPESIEKISGVDISDMMIETARAKYTDQKMSFYMRGQEGSEKSDIVIELGVHAENLEKEIEYVKSRLSDDGYFVYSAAGKNSMHARFKLRNAPYLKDYKTYEETESVLAKHFEIVNARAYGIFIPKLWAVPALARILQPVFEVTFRHLVPSLFHEKIYLLKLKKTV